MKKVKDNAFSYLHNFDIVFKWIGNIFTGQTLDVLGIKTGKIVEVRGLEPVTLQAKEERVDILLKDENDIYYHLEEERNCSRQDLYRFAAQHFLVAEQVKSDKLVSILVVSGNVTPRKKIETPSGNYSPTIINFNDRNGEEKLEEIKKQEIPNVVELVFLPMYKASTKSHSEFAKDVLLYTKELYEKKKIKLELLGALVIICNKMIPADTLKIIWKELSMLKVFKYAEEIGEEKGEKKRNKEIAMEMLKDNMSIEQIIKFSKLSKEEVLKLEKELNAQKNQS